ncbi:hypothetical protein EZJ43_15195 [Pedobacter changchengzhani]|uniref:LTD domain-containing protein n=1 Tax=Pedobacter changchengzhani TaxID=2529274 RepID=A0A4R5MHP3_9SPHI|nr:lamin tail domain-containing protein [Pedobacter changchengzhani]TDG35070.1 hypothetical protein EZJ43_15195 [Pedobacter changchengzhani]
MLKITLISLLLFSKIAFSQVTDHFSDGNFTQNPVWQGDVGYFIINAQKQLQSNGQQIASQNFALSTANEYALNAHWEFFVQLNFDPTTTNFVRIYLISDQADLKGNLNGYFIQIGETGSTDGYNLYRQKGTSITKIISGAQKSRLTANVLSAKISVNRDADGKWELFTDVAGGSNFISEGTVLDKTFISSSFMGVYCKYATASRYNQYIFDDFVVDELVADVTPPTLKSIAIFDAKTIDLNFSEPLDPTSALLISNYSLSNGYGNPVSVSATSTSNTYRLSFTNDLATSDYTITVNNVKDKKGNEILNDSKLSFFYIKSYSPKYGDLVINEIFANPTGSLSLPQKEFIEVWNTTDEYILTKDLKYSDQTSTYTFTTDTIKPKQFVVLCAKADTALFKTYGKTIGLSPWPSLNNDKDILTLKNANGEVVDRVAYYDTWYKDAVKKSGGFSLELIDPKNVCTGIQNWIGSNDASGGTPGKINSVYRDQLSAEIPKIFNVLIIDSVTIQVNFSKPVDSLSASLPSNYLINNGVGEAKSAVVSSPLFVSVLLKFAEVTKGIQNTLTVKNVTDCAGNLIDPLNNTATLFMAKKPLKNEILISEVLFNPKGNGVDFVEIFNNSDHELDLKDLQLANADVSGNPASVKDISANSLYILPGSYWVLSTNSSNVKANYYVENPNNFVPLTSFPSFNNDKGSAIILTNNQILDRFNYTEKMHNVLLQNPDGVSLERVSFTKGSNEIGNFKSAASSVGFATPTYKNSQQLIGNETYVKLVSKTFSPDGDGFEDLLYLDYKLEENSNLATVNIFTDRGKLVKKLLKNQTIATSGQLIWDGLNDAGGRCSVGIYVLVFESFDLNGNINKFKNTFVLATKLN